MRKKLLAALAPALLALPLAAPAAMAQDGETYQAELAPLNDSGASGTLMLELNGEEATITSEGTGSANSLTRSTGGARRARWSSCRSVMSTICCSSIFIRLTVKAPVSLLRSRVWSGGSMAMNMPGSCGDGSVAAGMPGVSYGTWRTPMSRRELNRVSAMSVRTAS